MLQKDRVAGRIQKYIFLGGINEHKAQICLCPPPPELLGRGNFEHLMVKFKTWLLGYFKGTHTV